MMRISELKERRIIRRATQNFDAEGKRIYNEFEYDFPYNPTHKGNERERLYAKIFDLLPFIILFHYGFHQPFIMVLFWSVMSVLILGSIIESAFGTTLGKKLFKLTIVDDFGNRLGIFKSALRNILSLLNFFPVFSEFEPGPNEYWAKSGMGMNFSMHLNNQITKTFIVKESKIPEIKKMLQDQSDKKQMTDFFKSI